MKPKLVIFTLLFGVAALVLAGLLYSDISKENVIAKPENQVVTNNSTTQVTNKMLPNPQESGNVAMTVEEQASAMKEKDLDALNEALVHRDDDPRMMLEIANRLENADADVRAAAREAAIHFGDTNIIPFLKSAQEDLQDPREKVAIMDAIAYLQINPAPDSDQMDPAMESMLTNSMPAGTRPIPAKRHAPSSPNQSLPPGAPIQQPPLTGPQGSQ